MKQLLKNGSVVNVFTGEIEKTNVLIEDGRIISVGSYNTDADVVEDVQGKFICPGFIDGHIHIESTMLLPEKFAEAAVPHGTTAVVADPHEIANVCGSDGIEFMLSASEGLPLTVYIMVPSCVPATRFDESGAVLCADDIESFFGRDRVLGLAEMMNYPGVICDDRDTVEKLRRTLAHGMLINGHAPLLTGAALDKYISAGITDDHECSYADEAIERIRKGQRVMIRQGTAARNLAGLISLFDEPYSHRCMLVTDDKHPADLLSNGHIDDIIRQAVQLGKSAVTGIRMATIQAAEYFGLKNKGAVAPGYDADILILDDLDTVKVQTVCKAGIKVAQNGKCLPFVPPQIPPELKDRVCRSLNMQQVSADSFSVDAAGKHTCRVIEIVKGQLITEERLMEIDFDRNNGIDTERDILKIAVIERHNNTGHIGTGFISGIGLKKGAIASTVSHDSHNLIVIGTNGEDMAYAANKLREIGGGLITVCDGEVMAQMALPYGGLMTDADPHTAAEQNEQVRQSVHSLNAPQDIEPFMNMAFVSLPVIPHLKLTTFGLVNVDKQELSELIVD